MILPGANRRAAAELAGVRLRRCCAAAVAAARGKVPLERALGLHMADPRVTVSADLPIGEEDATAVNAALAAAGITRAGTATVVIEPFAYFVHLT